MRNHWLNKKSETKRPLSNHHITEDLKVQKDEYGHFIIFTYHPHKDHLIELEAHEKPGFSLLISNSTDTLFGCKQYLNFFYLTDKQLSYTFRATYIANYN
jgi:hypothetical protein